MTALGDTELVRGDKVWPTILIFAIFLALFGVAANTLLIEFGLKRYYLVLAMWTPGLAAIIALKAVGLPLSSLGWRWGIARYHVLAYLLPVVYGLAAYGFLWFFNLAAFGNPKFAEEAEYYLGIRDWSELFTLMFSVAILASAGMVWHMATVLGEEIGWRGFLTPFLMRKMTFAPASIVTGLIWACWHGPIIFFAGYNGGSDNLLLEFCWFTLLCISLSFVMTYLRLKSHSLWPVTVLHAAHNVYILIIFKSLTLPYDISPRYAGEFGMVLPLVLVGIALLFWYLARRDGIAGRLQHH